MARTPSRTGGTAAPGRSWCVWSSWPRPTWPGEPWPWWLVSLPLYSSEGVSLVEGRAARVTHSTSTVYQMDPGPVRIILALLGGALVVSTASLLWRVARRTTRVGVTGMAAAASAGAVALLGMLTVGPFILPLAVLLTVLALPIAPDRRPHPPAHGTVHPDGTGIRSTVPRGATGRRLVDRPHRSDGLAAVNLGPGRRRQQRVPSDQPTGRRGVPGISADPGPLAPLPPSSG